MSSEYLKKQTIEIFKIERAFTNSHIVDKIKNKEKGLLTPREESLVWSAIDLYLTPELSQGEPSRFEISPQNPEYLIAYIRMSH